jgi:hypothetical protein
MFWGGKLEFREKGGRYMNTKHPVAIPLRHGINYPLRALRLTRLSARLLPALIFFLACPITSAQQAIKTGPEVGSTLPSFEAPDQNGRLENLQTILGPKGALLVFYRSADW